MANNEQPKRKGVSMGMIFSFVIVIAILIGFITMFNGSLSSTDTFTESKFVQYLMNDHIIEVMEKPKESTNVTISGKYVETNSSGKKVTKSFTYVSDFYSYYVTNLEHTYTVESTNETKTDSFILKEMVLQKHENGIIKKYSVKDVYVTSFFEQYGPTLIMLLGSAVICFFLFSRLAGSVGASNNKALDFNKSRAKRENASKVRFSDVAGADEEKVEMQEIVSYLKEPKKYVKFGAKLPKGILLVGPPGCGKTLLAKAVAGEAGVPFYSISGSDFVEMFVGVGAGRVRDMFKVAKENAPCLVFIDEIDAVGRQRGAGLGGGNDEREQTLNQLLVEMDGFNDNSGIIVIAATNRDDVLDPALLRAGRFDRKITVNYPDSKGREEIFKVHARNKVISPDVNFHALAKRTVGFSGADIENILNEAAILAVRKNIPSIGMDEIDEAIDRRIAGPAKSSRLLSKKERKMVAYHEAGHAIIGLKLPYSDVVQKITIVPRGNTGGHVRMTPDEDRFLLTKNELEARIVGYLGGRTSEEIFFDEVTTGAQNDIEVATRIARMMVTELGMSSLGPIQYEKDTGSVFLGRDYTSSQKNFSTEIAFEIDKEVRKIIDSAHEKAREIITKYKDDVALIADTLIERESITAEQIDYLLEHRHLMNEEERAAALKAMEEKDKSKLEDVKDDTSKNESSDNNSSNIKNDEEVK